MIFFLAIFLIYVYIDWFFTSLVLEDNCGVFTQEALDQMEICHFYVEGIALAVLGSAAILTNIFTIYVFIM